MADGTLRRGDRNGPDTGLARPVAAYATQAQESAGRERVGCLQAGGLRPEQATAPPLDPPRAGFATAELAGRLYLVGGFYPGHMTSDIVQSLAIAP